MAKQGMKRPTITKQHPKNETGPVPILQGKAKSGQKKANPIVADTMGAEQKVWHEKPIPPAYPAIDNDLAVENLANDLTMADLQDLQPWKKEF